MKGLSHTGRLTAEPAAAEFARQSASSSASPDPSPAHASADHSVVQRLRHSLAALLLGLPLLLGLAAPVAAQAQNTVTFAEDVIYTSAETTDVEGHNFRALYLTPVLRNAKATDVYVHVRAVQPTENLNGYAPARIGSAISLDHATPITDRRGTRIPARQTEFLVPVQTSLLPGSCGKYFFVEITKVTTDGRPNSTNIDSSVAIGNPSRVTVFIDHCLVSNNGQTGGGGFGDTTRTSLQAGAGQAFTTGSHVKGYTLTGVGVVFEKIELDGLFRKNNPYITATIRNESGGSVGTTVGTLNLPSTSPATFDSDSLATDETFTFIAPGKGIKLEPSSTYFVVIEAVGERRTDVRFRSVDSNAENAGGAAGFSIADGGAEYRYYSDPPAWAPRINISLQIGVNGYANPITDVVQMSNVKRSIAEFGNGEKQGGARFVVEIGAGMSPKGHARTINYTVGGTAIRGNADNPKDYYIDGCKSSTCSLRLPANRHSDWITIYVNDDGIDENNETIVLTLQDGSGYTVNKDKSTTTVTISDDDTRGLDFRRSWADVDEGGSDTYTVRLKSQPTAAVTVKIVSNNPDVTVSPTSLTFNPSGSTKLWSRAQTVTVSAAQDNDAVDEEATLTYTTSGGDYGGAGALSIDRSVSVDDDDTADPTAPRLPRISVTGGAEVTEGAAASFTVNADPAPTSRLTVNVEVIEPPGQDFVAASQERVRTVVLNAGATSATFTVPTVNDNSDEDDGFVQVYVNDGTGYAAGQGAAVSVRDNDDPIPAAFFRLASSDSGEGGGTHNVRVDLTRPAPSGGLTLRYSVSGTAAAGSSNDFTIQNSGTLSIAAGGASATIPVAINDDSARENTETVILTLTGGTGYTVDSPSVHTLTIADNDSTSASFGAASSSVDEDAGTHNVTVNLSQAAPSGGLSLSYSVTGTATAGSGNDFTIQNSGSLSIQAGSSSANIPVAISDDSADETAETVILTLTSGAGYTLGSTTTHTLTIAANDPPASTGANLANLGSSPLPEGADVAFNLVFPSGTRSVRAGDPPLTLPLTIGGTATLGTDYRLSCADEYAGIAITCSGLNGNNPTITFDGSRVQSSSGIRRVEALYLEALEDNTSESDETVKLAVGDGDAYTLTIKDAPSSVSVSFTSATYSTNEAWGQAQPVILVTPPSGSDLTIPLIFTDGTATDGEDYTSLAQVVYEATGKDRFSFDIPIINDTVYEGDETFTVAIDTANLPTGVTAGATTSATVTIEDDDPAPNSPQLVLSRSSLTVAEGSTGSYALKLATQPTGTVTVNIASDNNDITVSPSPVTFQSTGSSKLWNVAQTITVTAAQDVDATDDSGTLTHTASGGGYGSVTGSVSVTVNDDDNTAQPSASFASDTSTAAESAGTRNVRVNLSSAAPSGGLTLNYSVGGTATAGGGNDFTIQGSGSLSITAGATSANIPVAINDDSNEESAETVILTLTGGTGYTLGSTRVHTLTITDNDKSTNACVSSSLLADVEGRSDNGNNERWTRVKNALTGQPNAITLAEVKEIRDRRAWYGWSTEQWDPVIAALECLARATSSNAPVISIAGADGDRNGFVDRISEGDTAHFTLTATPAPTSNLTVAVDVKNFNVGLTNDENRTRTVTIGASGTATLDIVTINDSKDCPTGTVYVSIQAGLGYKVAAEPDDADSVSVTDNGSDSGPCTSFGVSSAVPPLGLSGEIESADPAPRSLPGLDPWNPERTAGAPAGFTPDLSAGACVSPGLLSDAAGYANQTWRGPAHVERWLRVMQTFSGSASDATIVTPAEAQNYAIGGAEAWLPVAGALRCLEAQSLGGALSR